MMPEPYFVPAGQFVGRDLASLTPVERAALSRTRRSDLEEARRRLRFLPVVTAVGSHGPAPAPGPCQTLALLPRPRPGRRGVSPPRWIPPGMPTTISLVKWVLVALIVLLVFPELARLPGRMMGGLLRVVALRVRLVFLHFFGSLREELEDVVSDFGTWVDSVLPFGSPSTTEDRPTVSRLSFLVLGAIALKSLRLW